MLRLVEAPSLPTGDYNHIGMDTEIQKRYRTIIEIMKIVLQTTRKHRKPKKLTQMTSQNHLYVKAQFDEILAGQISTTQ